MPQKTRWMVSIAVVVLVSVASLMAPWRAGYAIAPWTDDRAVEPGPAPSGGGGERPGPRADAIRRHVSAAYGQLPLAFIENTGQLDSRVKFYERGVGRTTFLTAEGVYVDLYQPTVRPVHPEAPPARQMVTLAPVGMRQGVAVIPEGRQEGAVHYLRGNDPAHWQIHVPTYSAVVYQEAYPGIDIRFYGTNRALEYDVVVKPGADPSTARFAYGGIAGLAIGAGGELRITLPGGEVLEQRQPVIYQAVEGTRVAVAGGFRLYGQNAYGFAVGPYDRERPLIIDPVLEFSYATYLGGAGQDEGYSIAVDAAGQAYVTGWTYSPKFPTTRGALDRTYDRYADVFVTKLNAAGSALVYSTYLGGTQQDEGYSIAVDAAGRAYVTGRALSWDFPTTRGAFERTAPGYGDVFLTKLNAAGSALVYSTYLGGSGSDHVVSLAVDAAGRAYVTGSTQSSDFPTTPGAFDRTCGTDGTCNADYVFATEDVFVTKLNAAGSRLVYSTYLGGAGQDVGHSIAVDAAGQAYVTGSTYSPDFPTTRKAFDRTCGTDGNCDATDETSFKDAFITKLNAAGSALVYSTYLGGRFADAGMGVAVDAAGQAYILGDTTSDDLPTTPGALDDTNQECFTIACHEPFITKLNAAGSALAYSTYLGLGTTTGYGIALDAARHVYVTGGTFDRSAFPPKPGTLDPTYNGEGDAFVAKIVEVKGGMANDPCHESHGGETVLGGETAVDCERPAPMP